MASLRLSRPRLARALRRARAAPPEPSRTREERLPTQPGPFSYGDIAPLSLPVRRSVLDLVYRLGLGREELGIVRRPGSLVLTAKGQERGWRWDFAEP